MTKASGALNVQMCIRDSRNSMLQPSEVWVFPTLDAADISKKLLCMMPSVYNLSLIHI